VEVSTVFVLVAGPLHAQHVAGLDVYDAGSAVLAVLAGLALAVRLGLRPAGQRGIRGRPVDEVLLLVAAVGLAALLIHQLVTDGVCHGSCTLPLPTPSGRPS